MVTKGKKKRGPKYAQGEAKDRILLIALDYPDGIGERELVEEIQNKLRIGIKDSKVITEHLGDLGPGRRERAKWQKGQNYLIKIPSKFESSDNKENSLDLPKEDIEYLSKRKFFPEDSIFLPNEEPEIFILIAEKFLNSNDETAFAFISAKTTQKMLDAMITLFEKRIGFGFTDDTKSAIKRILPWSPTAMKRFLFSDIDSIMRVEKLIELVKPQCINIDINIPEQIDYQKIIEESPQAAGIVKIIAGDIAWTLISLFDRISHAERTILKLLYACMITDLATNPSLIEKIEERNHAKHITDQIIPDDITIKTSRSKQLKQMREEKEKGTYNPSERLRQYFVSETENIKEKGD